MKYPYFIGYMPISCPDGIVRNGTDGFTAPVLRASRRQKRQSCETILPYHFMEMLPKTKKRAYAAKPSNFYLLCSHQFSLMKNLFRKYGSVVNDALVGTTWYSLVLYAAEISTAM